MTEQYRLLQLGAKLYETGKEIRRLQKKLEMDRRKGQLASEAALSDYRTLEQTQERWAMLEAAYQALAEKLRPPKGHDGK